MRLPFEAVVAKSEAIRDHFTGLEAYRRARRLALYASFKNEVLTDPIFDHALSCGKEVFFPKVIKGIGLSFFRVREKGELVPGTYSLLEPCGEEEGEVSSMDLVVVPGIAFDRRGYRIGYGRGYYDMTLGTFNGPIVGLAYEMQVLDEVPHLPHDIRVERIVTEKGVIRCIPGDLEAAGQPSNI